MIQQCLANALKKQGIHKEVATIVTQVMVASDDPAFKNPLKPVGPIYEEEKALERLKMGYPMRKQKTGWRMVVPSPIPISIVEESIIKKLLKNKYIVITAGGGGMPVIDKNGTLEGKEAVIDKDLVSERLATALDADLLLLLTDVDYVYLEKDQLIYQTTRKEMEKYFKMGYFPEGSMGPKIAAGISFLKNGGKRVAISSLEKAWEAAKGEFGTQILNL
jgi:carbamate kinase